MKRSSKEKKKVTDSVLRRWAWLIGFGLMMMMMDDGWMMISNNSNSNKGSEKENGLLGLLVLAFLFCTHFSFVFPWLNSGKGLVSTLASLCFGLMLNSELCTMMRVTHSLFRPLPCLWVKKGYGRLRL